MKNERSIEKSAGASLNQVIRFSKTINTIATKTREKGRENFDGVQMSVMRGLATELLKSVHEYNAYMNTLTTE